VVLSAVGGNSDLVLRPDNEGNAASVCGRAIALKNISAEITATINRLIWRSKCEVTTNLTWKVVGIGIGNVHPQIR